MIEERYERHAWPRGTATRRSHLGPPSAPRTEPKSIAKRAGQNRAGDKRYGRTVFMPVRYADDFIILMSTPSDEPEAGRTAVEHEKAALADQLERELGLQLSEEKTLITPVTSTIRFLGHHLRVRKHPDHGALRMRALIPKERTQRLRLKIKAIFRSQTYGLSLESRLMNPIVRGWANFYRHAWRAKRIFVSVDDYVWWTIYRWVRKKHAKASMRQIYQRYGWHKPRGRMMRWRDGDTYHVSLAAVRVKPFRLAWLKTPHFASTSMESPVRIERRMPGSVRGARKPARVKLK
jgi:RNA-directed DNA polymerase